MNECLFLIHMGRKCKERKKLHIIFFISLGVARHFSHIRMLLVITFNLLHVFVILSFFMSKDAFEGGIYDENIHVLLKLLNMNMNHWYFLNKSINNHFLVGVVKKICSFAVILTWLSQLDILTFLNLNLLNVFEKNAV